jgi:hypothetical protein
MDDIGEENLADSLTAAATMAREYVQETNMIRVP